MKDQQTAADAGIGGQTGVTAAMVLALGARRGQAHHHRMAAVLRGIGDRKYADVRAVFEKV